MKKTVFLKKGQSYFLPKIIYDISEPHGDLLHWNLSWASTFNFLAHQERVEILLRKLTLGIFMVASGLLSRQKILMLRMDARDKYKLNYSSQY